MLFYCDRQRLNLTIGFFIFLFMVTSRGIINICSAGTSFTKRINSINKKTSFRKTFRIFQNSYKFYGFVWLTITRIYSDSLDSSLLINENPNTLVLLKVGFGNLDAPQKNLVPKLALIKFLSQHLILPIFFNCENMSHHI